MTSKDFAPGCGYYSRGELELELGKLALSLGRLEATHQGQSRRAVQWPQPAINEFLETCLRLLARTRASHRAVAVQRLCYLATSAELGLIGLEAWLQEQPPPQSTSDARMPVHVTWQGEGGTTAYNGHV